MNKTKIKLKLKKKKKSDVPQKGHVTTMQQTVLKCCYASIAFLS